MPEFDAVKVASLIQEAIRLALEAEQGGNLPIGAVVALGSEIVGRGRNAIWRPRTALTRHAEVEALESVPAVLWPQAANMTLVTTLEPCLMCAGAILLHGIGTIVFGSDDPFGGASVTFGHLPAFFDEVLARTRWIGPAFPKECDPLYQRISEIEPGHPGFSTPSSDRP